MSADEKTSEFSYLDKTISTKDFIECLDVTIPEHEVAMVLETFVQSYGFNDFDGLVRHYLNGVVFLLEEGHKEQHSRILIHIGRLSYDLDCFEEVNLKYQKSKCVPTVAMETLFCELQGFLAFFCFDYLAEKYAQE